MNYAKIAVKLALQEAKNVLQAQNFVKKGNMFFRFKNKCMLQFISIVSYWDSVFVSFDSLPDYAWNEGCCSYCTRYANTKKTETIPTSTFNSIYAEGFRVDNDLSEYLFGQHEFINVRSPDEEQKQVQRIVFWVKQIKDILDKINTYDDYAEFCKGITLHCGNQIAKLNQEWAANFLYAPNSRYFEHIVFKRNEMSGEQRQAILNGIDYQLRHLYDNYSTPQPSIKISAEKIAADAAEEFARRQAKEQRLRALKQHVLSGDFSQETMKYQAVKRTMYSFVRTNFRDKFELPQEDKYCVLM